jgi:hypothetical protein
MECRLQRCCLDGTSMRRARLVESVLADCRAASVDLAESTWRESGISGGRLGAVMLAGATWNGVRVRAAKIGFANLAGATLEDVVFEGCEIGGLDLRAARARSVRFVDCTIDELNVAGATLSGVDRQPRPAPRPRAAPGRGARDRGSCRRARGPRRCAPTQARRSVRTMKARVVDGVPAQAARSIPSSADVFVAVLVARLS